jgi:hypothetical protein
MNKGAEMQLRHRLAHRKTQGAPTAAAAAASAAAPPSMGRGVPMPAAGGGKGVQVYFLTMQGCGYCIKAKAALANMHMPPGCSLREVDASHASSLPFIKTPPRGYPAFLFVVNDVVKDVMVGLPPGDLQDNIRQTVQKVQHAA